MSNGLCKCFWPLFCWLSNQIFLQREKNKKRNILRHIHSADMDFKICSGVIRISLTNRRNWISLKINSEIKILMANLESIVNQGETKRLALACTPNLLPKYISSVFYVSHRPALPESSQISHSCRGFKKFQLRKMKLVNARSRAYTSIL